MNFSSMDLTHTAAASCYHELATMPRGRSDPSSRIFGKTVRHLRYGRQWTLSDLGRFADMHPDYLGLIENGLNIPSLNTIIYLAEAFNVPVATLLEPIEAHRKDLGLDKRRRSG